MDSIHGFIDKFFSEHRKGIIILLLLVSLIGAAAGHKYYRYTQDDPQFCSTCHMMTETYKSWRTGKHWDVKCQTCHQMTIVEQNRLLVAYVARGATSPQRQVHGRQKPWSVCKQCHVDDVSQGAISLRLSYGHARHVFMENLGCENCHWSNSHDFHPDGRACSKCHTEKLVHGLGMQGLSCLKCHSYGEESPAMISMDRCVECHMKIPKDGPMARFKCFDCHKPHGKIKLEDKDCLGECHGNEARVGQHGLHMKETELGCLDCHKAHGWIIGKKQSPGLCDRCHVLKDPNTFIY